MQGDDKGDCRATSGVGAQGLWSHIVFVAVPGVLLVAGPEGEVVQHHSRGHRHVEGRSAGAVLGDVHERVAQRHLLWRQALPLQSQPHHILAEVEQPSIRTHAIVDSVCVCLKRQTRNHQIPRQGSAMTAWKRCRPSNPERSPIAPWEPAAAERARRKESNGYQFW